MPMMVSLARSVYRLAMPGRKLPPRPVGRVAPDRDGRLFMSSSITDFGGVLVWSKPVETLSSRVSKKMVAERENEERSQR